jgi:hypothetical protein
METRKPMYLILVSVLAILFMGGCASLNGVAMLDTPGSYAKPVTLQDLVNNWHAYTVYYAGISEDTPAALLFDPKNDGKRLVGKSWKQVKDKETLLSMISFIKDYLTFNPRLYSIVGPGDAVFGYLFSPTNEVNLKVVNADTIYVYDVESPLYRNDENPIGLGIPDP